MNYCEHLKKLLVEDGQAAVEQARQHDESLDMHLQGCPECRDLLQAWVRIPGLLDQLPEHEPGAELLQTVREAAAPGDRPGSGLKTALRHRVLAPSLASAAVLLAAIGLSRELLMHESPTLQITPTRQNDVGELLEGIVSMPAPVPIDGEDQFFDYRGDDNAFFGQRNAGQAGLEGQKRQEVDRLDRDAELKLKDAVVSFDEPNELASREYEEKSRDRNSRVAKKEFPRTETPDLSSFEVAAIGGAFALHGFDFLGHYQQTDQLHFQPASGYWANTYVPGDPEIRLLNARLAQWDRSWLENNAALERGVAPVQQPFDAPADNALALNLMADVSAISNSAAPTGDNALTRMRLQVGIRGIEHRRGQRPAMNVGLVVDLPADAPDDVRIATRALLDAMLQSKQAGDRFSLVMTGSGLVVNADDFRFGSLQLAKQHIAGQEVETHSNKNGRSALELNSAMEQAGEMVRQSDDPSRPLGSSSVILISANQLNNVEQLTGLAHEQAKEGITLSVFPLGSKPGNESVEQLVLAGLGNRRYLEAPGKARQLIEEELHASSRAVARAARLSIRLAPGVQLIDVVGSERLGTKRAQRVRDIENSMDRRLSTNLGIQADRGEDEDGIQVVIPSIFSGDSVTVLLDVVTDRPGAIADVSLRYKDLVFLRNGSLQGHLELPGGQSSRGPAELAVLKNLLSYHFVEAIEQAAEALGREQAAEAITVLSAMRATIEQARRDLPAWANDPDLIRDLQVLDRYLAALASPSAGAHHPFLADSLRYAAWAKTHRPLAEYATRSGSNERSH